MSLGKHAQLHISLAPSASQDACKCLPYQLPLQSLSWVRERRGRTSSPTQPTDWIMPGSQRLPSSFFFCSHAVVLEPEGLTAMPTTPSFRLSCRVAHL